MRSILLKSPAKLNLYLEILNRRSDGYHDIETVFERISLYDRIRLTLKEKGIKIFCNSPDVLANQANLAYKAAELLKEKTRFPGGIEINLDKKIPPASGLGGGSSNAATVMLGLNELWNLGLSKPELLKLGRGIGSDVPFFLLDESFAIGRGRGDELVPLADVKSLWQFLVVPKFKVFTRDVYNWLGKENSKKGNFNADLRKSMVRLRSPLTLSEVVRQAHHTSNHTERSRSAEGSNVDTRRFIEEGRICENPRYICGNLRSKRVFQGLRKRRLTKRENTVKILIYALEKGDLGLLGKSLYNRLEEVVVERYKEILQIKETLRAMGAKAIAMSGSGAAIFAIAQTKEEAMGWKDRYALQRGWQSFVVNTC